MSKHKKPVAEEQLPLFSGQQLPPKPPLVTVKKAKPRNYRWDEFSYLKRKKVR